MRITADPISTETMRKIDAHCKKNGGTRETFAVAAIEEAASKLDAVAKPSEDAGDDAGGDSDDKTETASTPAPATATAAKAETAPATTKKGAK